jgi:tetratricopeptide (TPR) repeat protein
MHEQSDTERLMYRARLLMEEGQNDLALATLGEIQTDDPEQERQIAYLSAWCHTRLEHWTEALRLLSPLYTPGNIEDNWNDVNHNERERRAFYLLCLGNAAVNLSRYEEASQHYTQCLKVLSERRVNLPKVRIKARYSLGMTCTMTGFYALAIQHYEEALRLCKNDLDHEDLPDMYYGLCDAYRLMGKFERAYTYGVKALELYEKRGERTKEGRIHNLLGRICYQMREYREATDHYMEALSIATLDNSQVMKMVNFTALADLRLAEERLDEAERYCQRALEVAGGLNDHHLCGVMYLICGKVALAESEKAEGERHERLFKEARGLFEKAKEHLTQTQASTFLAEVYGRLAQVLEMSGQEQEAITYWKTAYDSLSGLKGQSMD